MMDDLDELLSGILPSAPQCPEPTAIEAARNALAEMCRECHVWAIDEDFPVSATGPDILFAPQGTLLIEIGSVEHAGAALTPKTLAEMSAISSSWRETAGRPRYYTQDAENTLYVSPHEAGQAIHIRAYLQPGPTTTRAPRQVIREHREALCWGALARILALPGQAFSNLPLAAVHSARFEAAKARVSTKWLQGQQRAPLRTRPQFL